MAPFGAQTTIGKLWVSEKIIFLQITGPNALIFGLKYPWDKEIEVSANKVPGVKHGPAPRGHVVV